MYKVLTLNQISVKGLEKLSREKYEVASEIGSPDALLLRSHVLTKSDFGEPVKAIARAGAGVNNIPVPDCTEKGIPVFNTPGANANAVKELVLSGLLLGSRGILQGISYVNTLGDMKDGAALSKLLEKEKKNYKGSEIAGKTLGVVGLGAIGSLVAEMALTLGMEVVGYDPALSVEAAWRLPREVKKMENLPSLLSKSDFITLHLPVLDATRNLINKDSLSSVRKDAVLLNFAREQIVDTEAVVDSLENGGLRSYIADFPSPELIGRNDVVLMPHIGASTDEAEDNCAVMAAEQLKDFLENGNIKNSVNFPAIYMERTEGGRLAISNKNVPKILGNILSVLADADINVIDMINKSRDEIAYSLVDVAEVPNEAVMRQIAGVEGVINVRII